MFLGMKQRRNSTTRPKTPRYQKANHRVHHPMDGTYTIMDFPTNTWKVPSSPGSTVSDVTETLSSVSFLHANKEPRSITDLPSEMILRIYRYLDGPSEIIALNRTSRLYYWIWRMNAASISGAVIPRSIDCYISALELFEVEERVKQIQSILLPRCTFLKRTRIAQREARDAAKRTRRKDHWHNISNDGLYQGVLYRNGRLLSAARHASYVLDLIEKKVVYSGGTSFDGLAGHVTPSGQNIIIAYHELLILQRLGTPRVMEYRLKTMSKRKIREMFYVATYLVCHCPDKHKIRVGISRATTLRAFPCSWVSDSMDGDARPRCHMTNRARWSFLAVAEALREPGIPEYVAENRSGCHGDCKQSRKGKKGCSDSADDEGQRYRAFLGSLENM